jgi:hypothetical protein
MEECHGKERDLQLQPSRTAPGTTRPVFPHGRIACPFCGAHNDARSLECGVCGRHLPAELDLIVAPDRPDGDASERHE